MIKQKLQYIGLFGKWGNIVYILVSMCVRILNIMFILMYGFSQFTLFDGSFAENGPLQTHA